MIIVHLIVGEEVRQFVLAGSTAYTVGRRNCHIALPAHASVSRHHATITVLPTAATDADRVNHAPTVLIADVSKHGTTVNGELLSSTEAQRPVHVGDLVMFGTAASMRLLHAPIVVCPAPSLSAAEQRAALDTVCRLGGCLRDYPVGRDEIIAEGASPCATLLVAPEIRDDPCTLRALLEGYTVVQPSYLEALYAAVRESPGTELHSLPNPHAYDVPLCAELQGCRYTRPEQCLFNPGEYAHAPVTSCGVLRSRHLVFVDDTVDERLLPLVEACDGTYSVVAPEAITEWAASSEPERVLPLRGLLPDRYSHGMNVIFVADADHYAELENFVAMRVTSSSDALVQSPSRSAGLSPVSRALLKAYREGFTVVCVENIGRAVVSLDGATHMLTPGVPGVLSSVGEDVGSSEDDVDSNATTDGITAFRFAQPHAVAREPLTDVVRAKPQQTSTQPRSRSAGRESLRSTSTASPPRSTARGARGPAPDRDLYEEWMSFRRTESATTTVTTATPRRTAAAASVSRGGATPTPRKGSAASPNRSTTPRRKLRKLPDLRAEVGGKLEAMRRQVLHISDRAVDSGTLRRSDASLLNTIHQRLVNYLDWLRIDDTRRAAPTHWSHIAAVEAILACIEATVGSSAVTETP